MDRITLRGIRACGRHGAYEGERDAAQPFDIEIRLDVDLRAAEASDDLGDTVDYDALHRAVVAIVETTSFALLERLAGEILGAVFADARVSHAGVDIGKPGILAGAIAVVTLARDNPRYRPGFP